MSLITTFHIQLSAPQYALFRDALRTAEHVGDCRVILRFAKPRVEFTDYEGVRRTLGHLRIAPKSSYADVRSFETVRYKIDKGVRENLKKCV